MTRPRLHVDDDLGPGRRLRLEGPRAHYLSHVLRLRPGADVNLFNSRDGEFAARLDAAERHAVSLSLGDRRRPPALEPGPTLAFAPIRRNRLDWLVEKAVELGVAELAPVVTERTVVKLENERRLEAIVTEAAEQCGRLSVPALHPTAPLGTWLAGRARGRPLLLLDETGGGRPILDAIHPAEPCDILVGPEGGFAAIELGAAGSLPDTVRVDLGPLTLRAETAALAALAGWRLKAEGGREPRS